MAAQHESSEEKSQPNVARDEKPRVSVTDLTAAHTREERTWIRLNRIRERAVLGDQKWKRLRLGVFLVAVLLSGLASRPGAESVLGAAAGVGWVAFFVVIVLHSRFRKVLARIQVRVELELDVKALRTLKPRQRLTWDLAGLSAREQRINRDLDLFSSQQGGLFSQLFPFFFTDRGAIRFRDLVLKAPEHRQLILNRQSAVRFWVEHRVLRRRLLSQFVTIKASLKTRDLVQKAELQLTAAANPKLLFYIGASLQTAFWATFALVSQGYLPKQMHGIALLIWLGGFAVLSRFVDLLSAYPQAVSLAGSLRLLLPITTTLEQIARHPSGQGLRQHSLGAIATHPPSSSLKEIERCAGAMGTRQNPLLALIINVLIPWDLYWATRYEITRRQVSGHLDGWFENIATAEAQVAIAEWDAAHGLCVPKLQEQPGFGIQAKDLGHPLLSAQVRVSNDFVIGSLSGQKLHLITGSNMAGKSTFLRAVAMNLALVFAGARAVAASFATEILQIETSIKPGDSLDDGFSAFYAEVKDLSELLVIAREPTREPRVIYFIDEIFRGTNNRERRQGAEAVIRALVQTDAIGFLTTHDLDLALLEGQVSNLRNYHFRDDVLEGKMVFSYRYQSGPCPTTNATRVMAAAGLPIV